MRKSHLTDSPSATSQTDVKKIRKMPFDAGFEVDRKQTHTN